MNYMNQVADMLGVEIGEKFKFFDTHSNQEKTGVYWVDENGIYEEYPDGSKVQIFRSWDDILIGDSEIVKLPYKPRKGDIIFYVSPQGDLMATSVDISYTRDLLLVHNGMVYRTAKEALEHKDETMKKWAEIRKELEE